MISTITKNNGGGIRSCVGVRGHYDTSRLPVLEQIRTQGGNE
jgi:hypothetical protein